MGRKCNHIEWYPCLTCALKIFLFGLPFARFNCTKCQPNLNPRCRPCTSPPLILCDDGLTCAGCWSASPEDEYSKPSVFKAVKLRLISITLNTCAIKEGRNYSLVSVSERSRNPTCHHIQWIPCLSCRCSLLLYGLPFEPKCIHCTPELMPVNCDKCEA